MIPVNVLREILRRLGFRQYLVGDDSVIRVFVEGVKGMVLVFQEPKAGMVAMQFLIEQAEIQGAAELTKELKKIERRLEGMNS